MRGVWVAGTVLAAGAMAVGMWWAMGAGGPTAEEVLKRMAERETKVKALEYDCTYDAVIEKGHGVKWHVAAARVVEGGKAVEKYAKRQEVKAYLEGKEVAAEQMVVDDGKYEWTETRIEKGKPPRVSKNESEGWRGLGHWTPVMYTDWKWLESVMTMGRVHEEELDGKKMYVFEMTSKTPPEELGGLFATQRLYVSKEEMVVRKIETFDTEGNETLEIEFKGLKVDGDIDAGMFVYQAPEGAKVRDNSGEK
jgi:outer membrane lipoprotein-sorting protein